MRFRNFKRRVRSSLPFVDRWVRKLDNLNVRRDWVETQLKALSTGSHILDAGCGSQDFRHFATHLDYKAQDFGRYTRDAKKMMGSENGGIGGTSGYQYGSIDYVGDIWSIDEEDGTFDAILCTEVFEHIPYPIDTLKEFCRLLRPGGKLILTAPSNCLRHMDPFYFYSGFSDRWYEHFLKECGFDNFTIEPVGDYYSWLGVEMARTFCSHGFFAKLFLLPAFIFFFTQRPTQVSIDTLCMGYHVLAVKKPNSGDFRVNCATGE